MHNVTLYHVKDTAKFFNLLSECEGNVSMVNADGAETLLNGEDNVLDILRDVYVDGVINKMQLHLDSPRDAAVMMNYLIGA